MNNVLTLAVKEMIHELDADTDYDNALFSVASRYQVNPQELHDAVDLEFKKGQSL